MGAEKGGGAMSDIAKNIKKTRQQKGWTQERLAQELHVTRQAVSSWETGKSEPDIGMLESIIGIYIRTNVVIHDVPRLSITILYRVQSCP